MYDFKSGTLCYKIILNISHFLAIRLNFLLEQNRG